MDVTEQPALLGRPERGPRPSSRDPADVVEERRGEQQVGAEPRVQLRVSRRASRRRPCARAGRPRRSGALGGRQLPQRLRISASPRNRPMSAPRPGCESSPARNSRKPSSSSASRRSGGARPAGSVVGGLERADLELEPVAEALDAAEHAYGVALGEAAVEQLDVVPDPRLDPAGRVDELEREVRRALPRRPPLLAGDGVDALDRPVGGQLGDGAHETESRPQALVGSPRWPSSSPSAPFATTRRRRGRSNARRAAVRRDHARAARGAPRPEPVQRRPPDAARLRGGGGARAGGVARERACSSRSRRPSGRSSRTTSARTASRARASGSSPR